jgi:hypothetical protein
MNEEEQQPKKRKKKRKGALLNTANVKKFAHTIGARVSPDYIPLLEQEVRKIIEHHAEMDRTRKTLSASWIRPVEAMKRELKKKRRK